MSYSIFRAEGIKTTSDLRGIGVHNKDRKSNTNFDIDQDRSHENIELISLGTDSYLKRFYQIVEPYKQEHEERMQSMRADRVKSFEKHINSSKSDVAVEFLFTSDNDFFKDKSKAEIEAWANECLQFVHDDIGIKKDNLIHAVVHMDEKTPHLHVVGVPLLKEMDKRRNQEVWQISRAKFIPKKRDMEKLQDRYNERMNKAGYSLERGESSDRKHMSVSEYKDMVNQVNELKAERAELEENLKENQNTISKFKKIEQIDAIETADIPNNPNIVAIRKKDLKALQDSAKVGIDVQNAKEMLKQVQKEKDHLEFINEKVLEKENVALRADNERLTRENGELKEENTHLKDELEKWKEYGQKLAYGLVRSLKKENLLKTAKFVHDFAKGLKEMVFGQKEVQIEEQEKKPTEKQRERSKGEDFEIGD